MGLEEGRAGVGVGGGRKLRLNASQGLKGRSSTVDHNVEYPSTFRDGLLSG